MLILDIDDDELSAIARGVGATEKLAIDAGRAALRKTMRWASTRVRREVSRSMKLPQKAIKNRLKIRMPSGRQMSGAIWIGLDPVNPVHANARETKSGVSGTGGRAWPGAFIARGRNGGGMRVFKRETKARLPLESIRIHVDSEVRAALRGRLFDGIQDFYIKTFEHELKFRMSRA